MKVSDNVKNEAVAQAWEILHRREPLHTALRHLSTQLLAKTTLGPREIRNLHVYEANRHRDVISRRLTVEDAIEMHVKHLERLAVQRPKARPQSA